MTERDTNEAIGKEVAAAALEAYGRVWERLSSPDLVSTPELLRRLAALGELLRGAQWELPGEVAGMAFDPRQRRRLAAVLILLEHLVRVRRATATQASPLPLDPRPIRERPRCDWRVVAAVDSLAMGSTHPAWRCHRCGQFSLTCDERLCPQLEP